MLQLIRYDAACSAIAECARIDEAKDWSDKAAALAAYARQAHNPELEIHAAEIRARARRKIGELSRGLGKAQGARTDLTFPGAGESSKTKALEQAQVSQAEAHRCEQIASIPEAEIEALFAEARHRGKAISSDELLRKAARAVLRAAHLETLKTQPWPAGKYRVIYADPPWQYNDQRKGLTTATGATDYYPTMTIDEICALDVHGLATDPAVLFLWATAPLLPEGLKAMREWGFTYKTNIVWSKGAATLGNYTTASHEHLLIGAIGSCLPDISKREDSVQSIQRQGHSEKPKEFRDMIDRMYPHGPRVELFARIQAPGWMAWGNEGG